MARSQSSRPIALGLLLMLLGCHSSTTSPGDAGPFDAGTFDAGFDAGAHDAGNVDAGFDAGPADAGPVDAGPVDAGPVDAGPVDAGPVDAGSRDAGSRDAGSLDAGVDAGPPTLNDVDVILGPEEVVYQHSTTACEPLDLPDTPARAVRVDGGLLFSATNAPTSYMGFGPTLDTIVHDCTPVFISTEAARADVYAHWQWPNSLYRVGDTVYALVHDEYHDPVASNCLPGDTSPANPCWWNSITLATSTDDGHSFTAAASPANLVAAPHLRWNADAGGAPRHPQPSGYLEPSNIIQAPDGYYYAIIESIPDPANSGNVGACVMRTQDLAQPGSWRFWDGTAYAGVFVDPYSVDAGTPIPTCTFVSPGQIGGLHSNVTFNTLFQAYLLVGASVFPPAPYADGGIPAGPPDGGPNLICGMYASTSADLVNWSAPKLLREVPLGFPPCAVGQYAYPAMIDPADSSVNYENSGAAPYLYMTRNNGGLNRDLIRMSVQFQVH